jgi:hypothetical protein
MLGAKRWRSKQLVSIGIGQRIGADQAVRTATWSNAMICALSRTSRYSGGETAVAPAGAPPPSPRPAPLLTIE